jgi:hypothetical protein
MPTFGSIPHRLIPGVSVTGGGLPEGLTFTTNNAGGFGSAEWDDRSPPGVGAGDPVTVSCEGATVFEGKCVSVTTGIGESLRWHVSCIGHFDELRYNETVEAIFVDRDIGQWQATDCQNWGVASDFEIALETEATLRFAWPEADKTMCYQSETATEYLTHVGNAVPVHEAEGDFPPPDSLWTAAYYQIPGHQRITGLSFDVKWCFILLRLDDMVTPDYTNPIGPPDEKYGHRFARYPKQKLWSGFYGVPTPQAMYLGVYACDDPSELPTKNPIEMRTDPHLLHAFQSPFWAATATKFEFDCDCKMVVFYATYLPVQLPFNLSTKYSKEADHLVRTKWVARNRIYLPRGNHWVDLSNISVFANGYRSKAGGDDLADVFAILFPTASVESMVLPAPSADSGPTSIAIREPTTELAAITDLLGLYPVEMCWGVWEGKVLLIEHDAGAVSVGDEPGVDTTGAALSNEGAVDIVLVEFAPPGATVPIGTIQTSATAFLTVDLGGSYALVEDGWQPGEGVRAAYLDATGFAHCAETAAYAGQAVAIERRPGRWTGDVNLHAIAGASAVRAGKVLSGPGIAGALITSTSCNVDGDSVSFSLGNTGYQGRFPARVPGQPQTAAPHDPGGVTSNRRNSGRRRR